MKKVVFIIVAVLSLAINGFSQKATIANANKLYNSKLYSQAIEKYLVALKKDSSNTDVLSNLGDCYRLTNDNKGQLLAYGKLVRTGKAEELHKLYYGQALMEAGNYDDAKKYINEYKGDKRGENIVKGLEKMAQYTKNADAYKVDTVSFNTKYNDFGAVNFNGENVVFASSRAKASWITRKHGWTDNNYFKMFISNKEGDGKYSKPIVFLEDFATKYNDGPMSFSKDGNTIFFTRNGSGKKGKSLDGFRKLRIFQATIVRGSIFSLLDLKVNNKEYNCTHPAISTDGKTLYFSSDMGGGKGGMDIWYCKLGADGTWGSPVNLGSKVNTAGNEVFPSVTEDNHLYFSSNGHDGIGGLDVYETKIKDDVAGRVYNMGKPVNSANDDFAYNLNPEGKKGFLSSNRKNGGQNDDIYTVEVLRKVARGKTVNIIVKDKENNEPLTFTKIKLNTDSFETNEKGEFQTVLEEDINYGLTIQRDKYADITDSLSTNSSTEEEEFTKEYVMAKKSNISLLAAIYDARTGAGIPDVRITLKDLVDNNLTEMIKTDKNGEYTKQLPTKKVGDKLAYLVTVEKEGFITKTLNYYQEIKKEGEIQMNELLALTIAKVEVGVDLAKAIDIKPIYFDLGKAKIRPDAAIELDKMVALMKKYPQMSIELGAHTDCRGAAAQNIKLSSARAKASVDYIVSKGTEKSRISSKGYGESKLLNACACEGKVKPTCSEEEHAKNRRTEFIIVKVKD